MEAYLEQYPALASDHELVLQIILTEWLLQDDCGLEPKTEAFLQRFPEYADELRPHLYLEAALDEEKEPIQDLTIPIQLGRYEVIARIGKGGMGEVFLARDPHHGQTSGCQSVASWST